MSWKARYGTPGPIYAQHCSLLYFFTRSWTMNQDSSIIYLCADALSLDGAGDESQESNVWKIQVSVMQGRRFHMHRKNSLEYKRQLHVSIKPSLKEMWLGPTFPSIPCVLEYAGNFPVTFRLMGARIARPRTAAALRGGWGDPQRGYRWSSAISMDLFKFCSVEKKWKLRAFLGYYIEKKKNRAF